MGQAIPNYTYRVFQASDVTSYFYNWVIAQNMSYWGRINKREITIREQIEKVLAAGYRWVRTDAQWAIFELPLDK